jgi:5,10-methylenetetrahydromethanopterin reductase
VTAFEIGLAFQTDKPHGRYGELAAQAEARGFDVVSVFADLLYQPPLPALLEMARATSRVRLGAACQNPFTDLDVSVSLPPGLAERVRELVAAGCDDSAGALIPDSVLDLFAFSGTPEHVAALAQRVLDAGAGRVDFGGPHGLTDVGGVELLGREVLPLLRR